MTQEGYFVGSVAGVGRKAESPEQELQYFSPKYSTEIFSNFVFRNIIENQEYKPNIKVVIQVSFFVKV